MSLAKKINAFFKLIRIIGSIISASISGVITWSNGHDLNNSILIWWTIFFTITFGFAINDYVDYKKDSIYPDKHVIAAGLISRNNVLLIAIVLLVLSMGVTYFLFPLQQWINLILLFILSVYSYVNNRYGIIANVLVALCSALSILIALEYLEMSLISITSISVFFFIMGREVIKDINDVEADRTVNKSSFPLTFSPEQSFYISFGLTMSSLLAAFIVGVNYSNWSYLIFVTAAHIMYTFYLFKFWKNQSKETYKEFAKYSKISFLLLLPALIF